MTIDSIARSEESKEHEIRVAVAQKEDHNRILAFLREHYYKEEPLTVGCEPKEQDAADEEFNMSNIEHGTCLMVLQKACKGSDCDQEEEIIGVALAGPKDEHEADHVLEEAIRVGSATKWGRILKFLGSIERSADVCQRFKVSNALHLHVLATHRNARGRSLGKHLMQELMKLCREKSIPLLTADCTSIYSARICQSLNMECVNTAFYKDYLNESKEQVFKPPRKHDAVRTYAILL